MKTNVKKGMLRTFVFSLLVLVSTASAAHGGWHGGGWHGGGWHDGGWHGGGWYGGVPAYYGYRGGCQTIRVCNSYGHCWLKQSCY